MYKNIQNQYQLPVRTLSETPFLCSNSGSPDIIVMSSKDLGAFSRLSAPHLQATRGRNKIVLLYCMSLSFDIRYAYNMDISI